MMVERGSLGGTCVNVGCVPSKALIRSAEARHGITMRAFDGIRGELAGFDFERVVAQKDRLVADLQQAKYWDVLANYPSIELRRGHARFGAHGQVEVDAEPIGARRVLVATGAGPWTPPIPGLEEAGFLTSTTLMELRKLPQHLVVIGAGAIGLELAQAFRRFGSRVTLLEVAPQALPAEDATIADALVRYLVEEGLEVNLGVRVTSVHRERGSYRIVVDKGDDRVTIEADQLLVATGRRPITAELGLQHAEVRVGPRGEILVDEHLQTTRAGIYAAGDVIGDPAFVYVAAYAGRVAAENAVGGLGTQYDLSIVPRVTFTDPAVASVGVTEAQAQASGHRVDVTTLAMEHVPRAIAAHDTRGLIKLIRDAENHTLLGAHILAPEAGDIIQLAVMAMELGATTDQLASMLHPYLTNAEAMKLAAQTFQKEVKALSCCAS